MKILFINSIGDPELGGGAEKTLWTLIRGLRSHGNDCVLLATSGNSGLQSTRIDGVTVWLAGIRNLYWPFGRQSGRSAFKRVGWHCIDSFNPCMQRYVEEVIETEKPDVVSIHNLAGWSVSVWSELTRSGIPAVQVLHDYYLACPNTTMFNHGRVCSVRCFNCKMLRLPHKALSNKSAGVIGVSDHILRRFFSLGYFADVTNAAAIHNARSSTRLGLDTRVESPARDVVRFGYIGALNPTKGVERLIEAFNRAELPNCELIIAGTGSVFYRQQLEAMVANDRIRFVGKVRPGDFYPQVDVVVTPSLWHEALGMVVAEALAFGKPVLGAIRGGIPEMIEDNENGFLFDPDNINEFVACLRKVGLDQRLRERLGRAAAVSGARFVDVDAWVARYTKIYEAAAHG